MIDTANETKNIPEKINYEQALELTENEIRHSLKNAPSVIRRQTGYLARAVGKNIRARTIITVATNSDGFVGRDAIIAAAAIELLHLATLVHDDIIDNAAKRRGITSLHSKFGEKTAVLCGDYLFCLAIKLASSISMRPGENDDLENLLPKYLTEVLMGELRQNQNNRNLGLTEREYFKIISGKTAALFEASFYAGFVLSGEPENNKKDYLSIGKNIGLIFQLADDCADYEASQRTTKKPVLSDFNQGVITLPLIYSLKTDASLRQRISDNIQPRELKAAVKAAGGLSYTHSIIFNYYSKTQKLIISLVATQEKKERLLALLDKAAGINATQKTSK